MPDLFPSDHPSLRRYWHPVATTASLTNKPTAIRLLGEALVLARLGGNTMCFWDRCPHRGAPLSQGEVRAENIICPYHGLMFDKFGNCVNGGDNGAAFHLRTPLAVREAGGLVWLCLDKSEAPALIPEIWLTQGERSILVGPLEWAASAAQVTDNFLDVSHFPFIHRETFGHPSSVISRDVECRPDQNGFTFTYTHLGYKVTADAGRADDGAQHPAQRRQLTYRYRPPFTISINIEYESGAQPDLICLAIQPQDRASCRIFKLLNVGSNASREEGLQREAELQRQITAEDKAICEQLPADIELKTFPRNLTGDAPGLWLRKHLSELVAHALPAH